MAVSTLSGKSIFPRECAEIRKLRWSEEIGTIIAFVILLMGFMYAASQGVLQDLALEAADLGAVGHVIFILLYIFVAMPFGWGFSVVIVAGGFSFGWEGLIRYGPENPIKSPPTPP